MLLLAIVIALFLSMGSFSSVIKVDDFDSPVYVRHHDLSVFVCLGKVKGGGCGFFDRLVVQFLDEDARWDLGSG